MFAASILQPRVRRHKAEPDCRRRSFLQHVLTKMGAELREWHRRLRDRRELGAMSDRSLRDIGLTRYDAAWEARKPFWRA